MCCLKAIQEYLQKNLEPKRYLHSVGVSETSVKLADTYGADREKAQLAGLIHDCAKHMSGKRLIEKAKDHNIEIDNVFQTSPSLLHGPVGAYVAKEELGIYDVEIFDSIYYHTIGKSCMGLLTKIIYLSDFIEPNREFQGVDALRKMAFSNLDKALLMAFDNSIQHVIAKAALIHINTINARNYIIQNMG